MIGYSCDESKTELKTDFQVLGLSNWVDDSAEMEKAWERKKYIFG